MLRKVVSSKLADEVCGCSNQEHQHLVIRFKAC